MTVLPVAGSVLTAFDEVAAVDTQPLTVFDAVGPRAVLLPCRPDRVRVVLGPRGEQPRRVHDDYRALLNSPVPPQVAHQAARTSVALAAALTGIVLAVAMVSIVIGAAL